MTRPEQFWTEEEDILLKELIYKGIQIKECVNKFKEKGFTRTINSIGRRKIVLKIIHPVNYWKEEELIILKDIYTNPNNTKYLKVLFKEAGINRPFDSIRKKAKELGFKTFKHTRKNIKHNEREFVLSPDGSYKLIICGKNKQEIIFDACDLSIMQKYPWLASKVSTTDIHYVSYVEYLNNKKCIKKYAQHLILNLKDTEEVKFINNNPLDLRRINMTICKDRLELNQCKYKANKNSKSSIRGVFFHKGKGHNCWCARICVNYKNITLLESQNNGRS